NQSELARSGLRVAEFGFLVRELRVLALLGRSLRVDRSGRVQLDLVDRVLVDDRLADFRCVRHHGGLRMASTAEVITDDTAVSRGVFVRADTERLAQRSAERGQETAAR